MGDAETLMTLYRSESNDADGALWLAATSEGWLLLPLLQLVGIVRLMWSLVWCDRLETGGRILRGKKNFN